MPRNYGGAKKKARDLEMDCKRECLQTLKNSVRILNDDLNKLGHVIDLTEEQIVEQMETWIALGEDIDELGDESLIYYEESDVEIYEHNATDQNNVNLQNGVSCIPSVSLANRVVPANTRSGRTHSSRVLPALLTVSFSLK